MYSEGAETLPNSIGSLCSNNPAVLFIHQCWVEWSCFSTQTCVRNVVYATLSLLISAFVLSRFYDTAYRPTRYRSISTRTRFDEIRFPELENPHSWSHLYHFSDVFLPIILTFELVPDSVKMNQHVKYTYTAVGLKTADHHTTWKIITNAQCFGEKSKLTYLHQCIYVKCRASMLK